MIIWKDLRLNLTMYLVCKREILLTNVEYSACIIDCLYYLLVTVVPLLNLKLNLVCKYRCRLLFPILTCVFIIDCLYCLLVTFIPLLNIKSNLVCKRKCCLLFSILACEYIIDCLHHGRRLALVFWKENKTEHSLQM